MTEPIRQREELSMSKARIFNLLSKGVAHLEMGSAGLSSEEAKRKYGVTEIIKLASNENPLGPSPRAIEIAKKAAEVMNIYPDPTGFELRSAIAKTHGVKVEQVLHSNGSAELITFIGQAFINPGDECIIPKPTYQRYEEITDITGGEKIISPLREFRIDLEDMAKRVTSRTKLIVIVNPNNPTGDIVKSLELEAFLNKVGKDKVLIFDEAYAEYVEDKDFPEMIKYISMGFHVIVLRTFSKAYGLAGTRLGYAISSPEIIQYLNSVRPVFNVNRIAQMVGIEAMNDKDHLNRCLQMVWNEKKYCYEEFNKMGLYFVPTSANFIFVNVGVDDLNLQEIMTRNGVIIRPMTPWGYKGFIRGTIGTHYQNEKMVECLKKSIGELKS
jgi:histidinol-phosphate aminotransferase